MKRRGLEAHQALQKKWVGICKEISESEGTLRSRIQRIASRLAKSGEAGFSTKSIYRQYYRWKKSGKIPLPYEKIHKETRGSSYLEEFGLTAEMCAAYRKYEGISVVKLAAAEGWRPDAYSRTMKGERGLGDECFRISRSMSKLVEKQLRQQSQEFLRLADELAAKRSQMAHVAPARTRVIK